MIEKLLDASIRLWSYPVDGIPCHACDPCRFFHREGQFRDLVVGQRGVRWGRAQSLHFLGNVLANGQILGSVPSKNLG